jgi:hypothetical protein
VTTGAFDGYEALAKRHALEKFPDYVDCGNPFIEEFDYSGQKKYIHFYLNGVWTYREVTWK